MRTTAFILFAVLVTGLAVGQAYRLEGKTWEETEARLIKAFDNASVTMEDSYKSVNGSLAVRISLAEARSTVVFLKENVIPIAKWGYEHPKEAKVLCSKPIVWLMMLMMTIGILQTLTLPYIIYEKVDRWWRR